MRPSPVEGSGNIGPRERLAALVVNALGFASFYMLLPAVPVLAGAYGGTVVSGAATAVFMATTVATQLLTPEFTRHFRMSSLLILAGLALGPPALLYELTSNVVAFFLITAIRGCGFGLLTAVGSAAVMACTTPETRGRQIGTYGLVASLPAVVLPAAGLRLVDSGHELAAFGACTVLGVASSLAAVGLRALPEEQAQRLGLWQALGSRHIRTLPIAFLPFTMAYGAVFTFIPLWHRDESSTVLLLFAIGFTTVCLLTGRAVSVANARKYFYFTATLGALASLGAAYMSGWGLVVAGLLLGTAVGSAATVSLFLLTASTSSQEHGASAALWSVAFDGGIGLGALGLAIVAQVAGHQIVYVVAGACMTAAAALVFADARTPRQAHGDEGEVACG